MRRRLLRQGTTLLTWSTGAVLLVSSGQWVVMVVANVIDPYMDPMYQLV